MPSLKWTEEAIRAEAAKYDSKKAFNRGNTGAYQTILKRFPGMIDELFKNQIQSWDEQSLRTEAVKYDNKTAFRNGNGSAYTTALTRFPGMLDKLFKNQSRLKWTEQKIRTEATKYESRIAFQRGSKGAYNVALSLGLLDEIFENKVWSWDEKSVRELALRYNSRAEFQRENKGACFAAYRRFPNLLDEIFGKAICWNKDKIRNEAAKYPTKIAFRRGNHGAYSSAHGRFPGLLDELFKNQPKYTSGDVFYIWRVAGCEWMGQPVYKFGITSNRMGIERIKSCASRNRIKAVDIQLFSADAAKAWEQLFHSTFTVVPDLGFNDGKTEFRACCPKAVQQLVESVQLKLLLAA